MWAGAVYISWHHWIRPWQHCGALALKAPWLGRQHIVKEVGVWTFVMVCEKALCVSPAISLPGMGLSLSARVRVQEAGRGKCVWARCSIFVRTGLSFRPETEDIMTVVGSLKSLLKVEIICLTNEKFNPRAVKCTAQYDKWIMLQEVPNALFWSVRAMFYPASWLWSSVLPFWHTHTHTSLHFVSCTLEHMAAVEVNRQRDRTVCFKKNKCHDILQGHSFSHGLPCFLVHFNFNVCMVKHIHRTLFVSVTSH